MVQSLVELMPYLPDMGGNNHKVPQGETNQYISIPVPGGDRKKGELIFISMSHYHDSVSVLWCCCV